MRATTTGLAAASVLVTGCASIIKGGSQDLVIDSMQGVAQFEVRDLKGGLSPISGTTPATVTLNRGTGFFSGAEYEIEISRPGYQSTTRHIDSHVSGWYLGGNLVLGGLIGYLIVDPVTGAMWQLKPDELNVNLVPLAGTVGADPELEQWAQIAVAAEPPLALPAAAPTEPEPPAVEAAPIEPATAELVAVATAAPPVPDVAVAEPQAAAVADATVAALAPVPAAPPAAAGVTMLMPRQTAVYPQPRVDGARIRMLPPGHELSLESTLRNADGKWWFVRGAGVAGWILDAAVTP